MKKSRKYLQICRFLPAATLLLSVTLQAQQDVSFASNNGRANKRQFSAPQDTNGKQTLISVLKELNRLKGVFFLYSEESMSQRPVNRVKNLDIEVERILEEVLKNTGLRFRKVSENTFVI